MIKRGCIIAKIKPGSEDEVAKLFAESDESELPRMAGVRHRSLFILDDVYVHYVETDDDFVVEDLGSMNGTFVNGQRIEGPHQIVDGDQIHVGATHLTAQLGEPGA